MIIELSQAAKLLAENDDILILTHANPDGDTLGSSVALYEGLTSIGKRARVENNDVIPGRYNYLFEGICFEEFEPKFVVAVDVADPKLLGDRLKPEYENRVGLCIDHHESNKLYAEQTAVDADSSSTAEVILALLRLMNIPVTKRIAEAVYTGVSTDTGCFCYANTTVHSHITAAEMIQLGADHIMINHAMFETKSFSYLELERLGLEGLTLHFGGKVAIITLTQEMFRQSGYPGQECDSICAIPRQIEGVAIGATIREKPDGSFKISVRTNTPYNASEICSALGGGGHAGAAGCEFSTDLETAKNALLAEIEKVLKK